MGAEIVIIHSEEAGQRIDNFLFVKMKGLPKSRIYRALRSGEVRVNKGRVRPFYKLQQCDQVRIPPLSISPTSELTLPTPELAQIIVNRILYEDEGLIVIDKPAGLPVHGGTCYSAGLIEMMRIIRPDVRFLELVHRLDRDTSGCLMIAKKRSVLLELHRLLRNHQVNKQYLLLVKGVWGHGKCKVAAPLQKNCLAGAERIVKVSDMGRSAITLLQPLHVYKQASLLQAFPVSGRTHQIRVHAAYIGHPVVGDDKYGDKVFNRNMRCLGLKRLFLHSASISCLMMDPQIKRIGVCAPLDESLRVFLQRLRVD